jgi:hypothetical protein
MTQRKDLGRISLLLAVCGGADAEIIRIAYSKASTYTWIGVGIVLITFFGGVSGGYALFTVFENYVAACFGGLGFGLSLGYLDRSIISSIRKKETPNLLDRLVSPAISIAKLFISAGISVIVATPLQVKIFEQPIEEKLQEIGTKKVEEHEKELEKNRRPKIEKLEKEKEPHQKEIEKLKARADEASDNLFREVNEGNAGFARDRGFGPIAQQLERIKKIREQERDEGVTIAEEKIKEIQNKISFIESDIEQKVTDYQNTVNESTDILSRLNALSEIQKSEDPLFLGMGVVALTGWSITLFFIALDGTTITVRLLSPRTPYDTILEVKEKANTENAIKEIEEDRERDHRIAIKDIKAKCRERKIGIERLNAELRQEEAELRQEERVANRLLRVFENELDETLGDNNLSLQDKMMGVLNIMDSLKIMRSRFFQTGESKKKHAG